MSLIQNCLFVLFAKFASNLLQSRANISQAILPIFLNSFNEQMICENNLKSFTILAALHISKKIKFYLSGQSSVSHKVNPTNHISHSHTLTHLLNTIHPRL